MVACLILRLGMTGHSLHLEMARLFLTPAPCRRDHSPFSRFLSRLGGILDSNFEPLLYVAFWPDGGEKVGGY